MIKYLVFFIMISLLTPETSQEIYLIQFTLPSEMQIWYNNNWNNPDAQGSWKICDVYSSPDTSSEIMGFISSTYNHEADNFILYYGPKDSKELLMWNDSLGDWGYGVYAHTFSVSGAFVKLPPNPFPENSWIQVGSKVKNGLKGDIESLVGRIIYIQELSAIKVTMHENLIIEAGNYMVLGLENGSYLIRKEIPSDMPCGDEVKDSIDESTIVRYLVNYEDLIDENYRLRFSIAYPKGC